MRRLLEIAPIVVFMRDREALLSLVHELTHLILYRQLVLSVGISYWFLELYIFEFASRADDQVLGALRDVHDVPDFVTSICE